MAKLTALINGRLLDTRTQDISILNIVLNDAGVIVGLGYVPEEDGDDIRIIDLQGHTIIPNVIDSHVHLREPGNEGIETMASASRAALESGITLLVATPDTHPPVDTPEMVLFIHTRRKQTAHVPIYTLGMVTKEGAGETLAEMALMAAEGAIGFTDGHSLHHTGLMRLALEYCPHHPIVVTPTDPWLQGDGLIADGPLATKMGLLGIPKEAESIRVARDIALVERFGGHLHFFPITTRASVALIRDAKARGIPVTCGTAPHYLWFQDHDVEGYQCHLKVMPPLQSADDIAALIDGIQDGTIDTIASDHQPNTVDQKRTDFTNASPGISGIDTLIPATLHALTPRLPIHRVMACLSANPNRLFGLKKQGVSVGNSPSLSVFNLTESVTIRSHAFHSMDRSSPFDGLTLKGKALLTMIDGHIKWVDSSLSASV